MSSHPAAAFSHHFKNYDIQKLRSVCAYLDVDPQIFFDGNGYPIKEPVTVRHNMDQSFPDIPMLLGYPKAATICHAILMSVLFSREVRKRHEEDQNDALAKHITSEDARDASGSNTFGGKKTFKRYSDADLNLHTTSTKNKKILSSLKKDFEYYSKQRGSEDEAHKSFKRQLAEEKRFLKLFNTRDYGSSLEASLDASVFHMKRLYRRHGLPFHNLKDVSKEWMSVTCFVGIVAIVAGRKILNNSKQVDRIEAANKQHGKEINESLNRFYYAVDTKHAPWPDPTTYAFEPSLKALFANKNGGVNDLRRDVFEWQKQHRDKRLSTYCFIDVKGGVRDDKVQIAAAIDECFERTGKKPLGHVARLRTMFSLKNVVLLFSYVLLFFKQHRRYTQK